MSLEDLLDELGGLGSLAGAASGGLDGLAASLRGVISQQDAANNGLKQGRDALGHFTSAGQGAQSVMGKAFEGIASGVKAVTPIIAGLGSAVVSLASGPIPSAQQAMTALGETLGSGVAGAAAKAGEALSMLGPEGAAAGAAVEALGAAAGATIGALTSMMGVAIEVNEKLGMMQSRFAALTGSAAGGKAVQAMIAHLDLPFATEQVNGWAQSLLGAGIKGKQLEADVKAIAAATALMGEQGGAAAETLFKRLGEGGPAADKLLKTFQTGGPKADKLLKEMGLSLKDLGGQAALSKMTAEQLHEALAKAMAKKGAGPLADMGSSMTSILTKAQEGFRSLFSGLGPAVKPFMGALKDLFGLFGKGSGDMKALKGVVTAVFTPLFSIATSVAKVLKEMFKGFGGSAAGATGGITGMLSKLAAFLKTPEGMKQIRTVLTGIGVAFGIVAAAVGVVIAIVAGVGAFMMANVIGPASAAYDAFTALWGAASSAFSGIADAIGSVDIMGTISGWIDSLSGLASGAMSAASNFVGGLVDGIKAGAGAVVAAVSGLASSALGAFTGALGIHSPSAIMLEHGEENIAGAAATGIDRGAPKVAKASAKMGDAAKPEGGGAARGKGGGDGAGTYIDLRGSTFNGTDEGLIRRVLTKVWGELAGEAGAQGAT